MISTERSVISVPSFDAELDPTESGRLGVLGPGPEKSLAFWRAQLDGIPPGLELPFDFPRSATPARSHGTRGLELSATLSRSLKELAQGEGAALFETMLAAWQTLLSRWTNQQDIVVGSPVDGNLVAFRDNTGANPTFREMLGRTRASVADALAHQDISFERLLQELGIERATDRHPIFQVLFELHEASRPTVAASDRDSPPGNIPGDAAQVDLALAVADGPGGLRATLTFNRGLFKPETVDRLLGSFETLLQGIVASPQERIGFLPMVPAAELNHLLVELNDTALPYDRAICIHEMFAQQVKKTPDAIAVVGAGERWTYARLDEEANRLAAILRGEGVGPDVLVGLHLRRTPWLLAGMLGILKAGGAYVPLDPAYPPERLHLMIEDAQMPVLVTERQIAGEIAAGGATVICIDALPDRPRDEIPPAVSQPRPANLAYVIYTSGSTGRPKGVGITHQCVVALVAWAHALYTGSELGGMLFATSACFDVSVFESLVPLCLGGKIIVAENILGIPSLEARNEITLVSGVPSAMGEVVRSRSLPTGVTTINVAGEACPQSLIDDLYALGHVERVYDVYGPTETTVYSIGGLRRAGGINTIGRPLPNERVYLLDANLQPVPKGVRGELFIGGEKLARGYLNRPELTAEKFMEAASVPGERLYRTGDAARWLPDGTIEFLGRLDRQVKIRGFRVEPGEVETVLKPHPLVKECAVVPRPDAMGANILVAYVVGHAPAPDLDQLRKHLEEKLPAYLVPSAFVALDSLPRSPNGKLDVRALPAPGAGTERQKQYAPPRDGVEQQLIRVWEEVLAVKPIGIHDRFFDLGGHSLLAVRMVAQVEKKFGKKIPVNILFKAPTVERLAQAIRKDGLISARSSLVEIQPEGSRPPIFWLHTLGGGGGAGLFRYEKLARLLGSDQPSYGLIASNEKQPETFEALAAQYVGEIRAVQPAGPYHLGGYCFGGVLAYEVARQLSASGDKIALVILLDATPPNVPNVPGVLSPRLLAHFCRTLPGWTAETLRNRRVLRDRMRRWGIRLRKKVSGRVGLAVGGIAGLALEDVIDMGKYPVEYRAHAEAHWRAERNYQPQRFPGRLALIRPHRPKLGTLPPEDQWRLLGHEVDVRIVSGDHTNLLAEPQVGEVARAITAILADLPRRQDKKP